MGVEAGRAPAREWATGWPTVLVGASGMALNGIAIYSLGLIMPQLQAEFGWNRTIVSSGLLVHSIVSLIVLPFVGRAIDRFGPRRVALVGTLASGLGFCGFALNNGYVMLWWTTWAVFSALFSGANPSIWASAVSRTFVKGRGLAIGMVMSGAAISTAVVPQLTRWSIDAFGWRAAYPIVGITFALVTFGLVVTFLHDAPDTAGDRDAGALDKPGLTLGQALRDAAVLKILAATFLAFLLMAPLAVHLVPILIDAGIGRMPATALATVVAAASVFGKLSVGWVMDRTSSRSLPALCFALPGVACLLLVNAHASLPIAIAAAASVGLATGTILQLSAYLPTRYAGLRAFGQIYSISAGIMVLAGGVGPIIAGIVFDRSGSYAPLLLAGILYSAAVGLMVATLGRYPCFERPSTT